MEKLNFLCFSRKNRKNKIFAEESALKMLESPNSIEEAYKKISSVFSVICGIFLLKIKKVRS